MRNEHRRTGQATRSQPGGCPSSPRLPVCADSCRCVRVSLRRGARLRAVLGAFVKQHLAGNQRALSVQQLAAAGWPDEALDAQPASGRVFAAGARLRKLSLREQASQLGEGYLLAPSRWVTLVP